MAKADETKKARRRKKQDLVTVPVPIVELKGTGRDDCTQNKQMFLNALFERRGNITAACELVGIVRSIVYAWKKNDPEFRRAYKYVRRRIEQHLFEKAQNLGEDGDSTLLIFSLKALNRKKFDDKFALAVHQEKQGQIDPDKVANAIRTLLVRGEEPERLKKPDNDQPPEDNE